jgi:6-phosphogluconolactonase
MSDQPADVRIFESTGALVSGAADAIVELADLAIARSGRFNVALAGGDTPAALYRHLSAVARPRLDWSRIHAFWGDERCVPPDDPISNYRMARESLLDHVALPGSHVHRMHGEDDPADAARDYEQCLRAQFGTPEGPPSHVPGRRFDLILLGLGADGHTASLFPGLNAVREQRRWVMAEYVPQVSMWRLTLTPPVLNAAGEVLFLVTGEAKAEAVARVLRGSRNVDALPAQVVRPRSGRVRWFLDSGAAGGG